jgi:hypothetical protein
MTEIIIIDRVKASANITYKKLAVQWLNETFCFVSSSVLADSFVLRNRQLLVAANRWRQKEKITWQKKPLYGIKESIAKLVATIVVIGGSLRNHRKRSSSQSRDG